MTAAWWLLSLLAIPGLCGLLVLMNWLEVSFTLRVVADEVAVAWRSAASIEELEEAISQTVQRVLVAQR